MKLLNRTIRSYAIYSVITILLAIPLFYLVINKLVVSEIDEKLFEQKMIVSSDPVRAIEADTHEDLKRILPDLEILPIPSGKSISRKDTLYNIHLYDSLYAESIPYRVLMFPLTARGNIYLVRIRRPLLEAEDLIQSIVLGMSVLLVIFVAGLLILNRKLSKALWWPFYKTLQELREYQVEQSQPIQPQNCGIDEFNDLDQALHTLTKRSSFVYTSYKEFTENASHEMQTPLAIFRNKLELLMQTHPFTEEQAALVNDLFDTNSRLSQLNKSMLLLTKIENYYYHDTELIDLTTTVKKITHQLKHMADVRHITIAETYTGEYKLSANRTLIEILYSNLLSNAIRYNVDGGSICVAIGKDSLEIMNTSASAPLDRSRIFDRFYKVNANAQSTGLGLAICKKIADLYGLSLEYTFREGSHIFTLSKRIYIKEEL